MSPEKEPCSVTDETGSCPDPATTRGYCTRHYKRWHKNGTPGPVAFRQRRMGDAVVCSVPACPEPHNAKGFCNTHYKLNRAGKDLASVVQKKNSSIRLTEHEMGMIADLSLPRLEVAEHIGIRAAQVDAYRRKIRLGSLRVSDWSDYEIDFLVESMNAMTNEKMAHWLRRPLSSVKAETRRLRSDGVIPKRTNKTLNPWVVGGRALIAKTCPECGILRAAEWFSDRGSKRRGWKTLCRGCASAAGSAGLAAQGEKWKKMHAEYEGKLQAITLEKATNHGNEWTEKDLEVLKDPSKTNFEKALELGRTYSATKGAVNRFDLASKKIDHERMAKSEWHLFWEFEDVAVAS